MQALIKNGKLHEVLEKIVGDTPESSAIYILVMDAILNKYGQEADPNDLLRTCISDHINILLNRVSYLTVNKSALVLMSAAEGLSDPPENFEEAVIIASKAHNVSREKYQSGSNPEASLKQLARKLAEDNSINFAAIKHIARPSAQDIQR